VPNRVLAIDLGASGGKAVLGIFTPHGISYKEVYRFSNDPVLLDGKLYWDFLRLFHEIKNCLRIAQMMGGFDSIGVDTWGVDFGLLGRAGELLESPVHYRDRRTFGVMEEVFKLISPEELYKLTGIQRLDINTIFQLYSIKLKQPDLWQRIHEVVFLPDLINYFLTGVKKTEYTIASTSQLMNVRNKYWEREVLDKLGINENWFNEIILPGTIVGKLKSEICDEIGCSEVPVVAVASHDTASAVISVPTTEDHFVYLSIGTWSLLGTEIDEPLINDITEKYNFTNEGGAEGNCRLLKNIMGLWIVEELRREWATKGEDITFDRMVEMASEAKEFERFIDVDSPEFGKPGQMQGKIEEFCRRTGQTVPFTKGDILRCVFESLAMKYRIVLSRVEEITDNTYSSIYVMGGGAKNKLLCSMCANACRKDVITGLIDATAVGNALMQWIALKDIKNVNEGRKLLSVSCDQILYAPLEQDKWEKGFEKFMSTIGKHLV
jgi:rhamnulokinase